MFESIIVRSKLFIRFLKSVPRAWEIEQTLLSDDSSTGTCFGFDGSHIVSVEKHTFHHISSSAPWSGAAAICILPDVISYICTRVPLKYAASLCLETLLADTVSTSLTLHLQHEHYTNSRTSEPNIWLAVGRGTFAAGQLHKLQLKLLYDAVDFFCSPVKAIVVWGEGLWIHLQCNEATGGLFKHLKSCFACNPRGLKVLLSLWRCRLGQRRCTIVVQQNFKPRIQIMFSSYFAVD